MKVLTVTIHVKPAHIDEFIAATLANARGSRTEPGNIRYDVLRSEDDPNQLMLYEVYRDAAALAAHRDTLHFKTWLETVEDWFAEPRTRVISHPLFFGDAEA